MLLDLRRAPCIHHGKASTPWILHRKATMAGVEVGDDTLWWRRTHIGLEMSRGCRLHISPYCVLELRLRREMGGRHRTELRSPRLGLWKAAVDFREREREVNEGASSGRRSGQGEPYGGYFEMSR